MANNKWHWQPFDKVGKYQLDTPIKTCFRIGPLFYENKEDKYTTYCIEDTYDEKNDNSGTNSKLFVSDTDGLIKGIELTTSFIYQDYDFIGQPTEDVIYFLLNKFEHLQQPIHKMANVYYMYLTPVFEISLVEVDSKVKTVTVASWARCSQ